MKLADVDWRGGGVAIRGKGDRIERLPLPADAGESLLPTYGGQVPVRCAHGVLHCPRPYRRLSSAAIREIMA